MLELLSSEHFEAASKVMAAAFCNYPFFTYIFLDRARLPQFLLWLFPRLLTILKNGKTQVYAIKEAAGGPIMGVLICAEPARKRGAWEQTLWQEVRHGLLKMPFAFGLGTLLRVMRVSAGLEAHKKALGSIVGPFWYIEYLCIDPTAQAKGLGSRSLQGLMGQVLDSDPHATIVLSTSDAKNRQFYKKNGLSELCQQPVCGVHNWWYVYHRDMALSNATVVQAK